MRNLLKSMAVGLFGVAVVLLSACGATSSANSGYGVDGQSAYEFWKQNAGEDLNSDGKIDDHDFLLYLGGKSTVPAITIDENGYWVIDGAPTGVFAWGTNGQKGEKGDATTIKVVTFGTASYIWVDVNGNGVIDNNGQTWTEGGTQIPPDEANPTPGAGTNNELIPLNNGFVYEDILRLLSETEERLNDKISALDKELFTQHDLMVTAINKFNPVTDTDGGEIILWTTQEYKEFHTDNEINGNETVYTYKDTWLAGGNTFATERDAYYALMSYNNAIIKEYLATTPAGE
ncbi:MAG: hypothetical protein LBQ05_01345 [Christensenellaceae bacterium]|jgi:hypothetical protein|nr:hypothetical protein [Christensenellaceae bacterium]